MSNINLCYTYDMNKFDRLLSFVNFLNEYRNVLRIQTVPGQERRENDVEHSYIFAMYAWYICELYKINLDVNKILKYCLVHDLVEVYAGDTGFWASDEEKENKKVREHNSFLKIKEIFSDFPELFELIENYENKNDGEARFVYALDKTIDVMEIYIEKGKCWKELVPEATFEKHLEKKRDKIKDVEPAREINEEIHRRILEEGVDKFFNLK